MIKISAILLAAGMSQRMGSDKLLLDYLGKPLLQHSIDLLSELPVYERILVTTDARMDKITLPSGIRSYNNPHPERGINKSIHIGVEASTGSHYLFLTADQPKLTAVDIMPLLDAASENPDRIIHPLIESRPCSPTLFPGCFRLKLLELYDPAFLKQNDTGGKTIRDANPELCLPVELENPSAFTDIDYTDDYNNLM